MLYGAASARALTARRRRRVPAAGAFPLHGRDRACPWAVSSCSRHKAFAGRVEAGEDVHTTLGRMLLIGRSHPGIGITRISDTFEALIIEARIEAARVGACTSLQVTRPAIRGPVTGFRGPSGGEVGSSAGGMVCCCEYLGELFEVSVVTRPAFEDGPR